MLWKWFFRVLVVVCLGLIVAKVVIEESGDGQKMPIWTAYAFVGLVAFGTVVNAVRAIYLRSAPRRPDRPDPDALAPTA